MAWKKPLPSAPSLLSSSCLQDDIVIIWTLFINNYPSSKNSFAVVLESVKPNYARLCFCSFKFKRLQKFHHLIHIHLLCRVKLFHRLGSCNQLQLKRYLTERTKICKVNKMLTHLLNFMLTFLFASRRSCAAGSWSSTTNGLLLGHITYFTC